MKEGPGLSALLHRLAECPQIFLEEPRIANEGRIEVAAVVADLIRMYAGDHGYTVDVTPWSNVLSKHHNRQRLVLLACWLLADEALRSLVSSPQPVYSLLAGGLDELASLVDAKRIMTNEERREELVRYCVAQLDLRPAGESPQQAEDRLATLSSVDQQRILKETEQARRRAEEVRAALKQKAAQEAAAKVSRE